MNRRSLGNRAAGALLVVVVASNATAAPFRLTTADLARRDVEIKAMSSTDVTVIDQKSQLELMLPLRSLVELRRGPVATMADGWFALRTRDGQRIVFKPIAIQNDAVVCETCLLGERTIAIADVASIESAATTTDGASAPVTKQDELRLANGDRLRGIVSGGDAKAVTCQGADGQAVVVDWANVRSIRFAETQASNAAAASFRVMLNDGTRVRATGMSSDAGTATIAIAGGDVRVPLANVVAVEHLDGDALPLSWAEPTSATYQPFFPSPTPAVAVMSSYVTGENDATIEVRMRPKTTVRWPVDAAVRRFRGRCSVPSGKPFADVTIRVLDGERVAFERAHLTSGEPAIDIDAALKGGGTVALEADFGDHYDVQDEVVWLDAMLLKSSGNDAAK